MLVENFATGVMDRLGLGADALRQRNPGLIYVSASGLGRTANRMPWLTARCCNATRGSPGLNRHPDIPPRVGFAWLDPMCGLMLAFVVAAARWQRRQGVVARVDFSMIEAMLWTLAKPLLAAQSGAPPVPRGNQSVRHVLHGAWRCAGDDAWISIAVGSEEEAENLRTAIGAAVSKNALAAWLRDRAPREAEAVLRRFGVAAAALASSVDLVASKHLRARGFWEAHGNGVLPGLPWRASFGRRSGDAPGLGADTETVLTEMLGLSVDDIDALRRSGASDNIRRQPRHGQSATRRSTSRHILEETMELNADFPSARQSMRGNWPGHPRQSPAWTAACSTASARRSREPHQSSATRQTSLLGPHARRRRGVPCPRRGLPGRARRLPGLAAISATC